MACSGRPKNSPPSADQTVQGARPMMDKNLLFGGASIGNLALCVKAKGAARYGVSGLLSRVGAYENARVREPELFKCWER